VDFAILNRMMVEGDHQLSEVFPARCHADHQTVEKSLTPFYISTGMFTFLTCCTLH